MKNKGENQDPGTWLLPEMLFQQGLDFISVCSACTPQLPLSLTYLLAPSHSSLFTSKGCELSTMEILLLPWLLAPSCLPALEFSLGHYLAKQCIFSSFNILFSPSFISPTPQSLCCFFSKTSPNWQHPAGLWLSSATLSLPPPAGHGSRVCCLIFFLVFPLMLVPWMV